MSAGLVERPASFRAPAAAAARADVAAGNVLVVAGDGPPVCGWCPPQLATVAQLTPQLQLVHGCTEHARRSWKSLRALGLAPVWWRLDGTGMGR